MLTGSEIIVVSGLPRSGTSLMMQMLASGGVPLATDQVRAADVDNPRGYYEYERVKKLKQDASWLPELRGQAVKMISQLLYDLPPSETYRILFMERDLDEVLLSQEKMLRRLGRPVEPREAMKPAYALHLQRLRDWLGRQANMALLSVRYADLIERPAVEAERVSAFLGGAPAAQSLAAAVDPALYRNRK